MKTTRRRRRAFTLVELLVVITIIGILAAILVPVVGMVQRQARRARIVMDMSQLESGFVAYEEKYGDRPPDFSNPVVVNRHLQKAFPRISAAERSVISLLWSVDTGDTGKLMPRIDPAEAIVFWLGGLSSDPKRPFTGPGGPIILVTDSNGNITGMLANPKRNSPLFEFEETRLTQFQDVNGNLLSNDEGVLHNDPSSNDAFPVYLPPGLKTPYVYFDSRTYVHSPVNGTVGTDLAAEVPSPPMYPLQTYVPGLSNDGATSIEGVALPYRSDNPRLATTADPVLFECVNEKTYQIITAGLDNNYGAYNFVKRYPSGVNYGIDALDTEFDQSADYDNICNFSDGRTLEDCIP